MVKEHLHFRPATAAGERLRMLDMNNQVTTFAFEIGLNLIFSLNIPDAKVIRYVVQVTPEMINEEVDRLQNKVRQYDGTTNSIWWR